MYKSSKYNHFTENEKGDLLLYNALLGNFCKVTKEHASIAMNCLFNDEFEKNISSYESKKIFDMFKTMEFLIPAIQDETIKLNLLSNMSNEFNLTILPTEQCNFRCVYCYESFTKEKMNNSTQSAIKKNVKKHINKYNNLRVNWYGGEPLMAMDVIENLSQSFQRDYKNHKRHYFASITTNGYLLTLPVFKKLLSYNVINFQITIDGLQKTHNRQRPLHDGSESFDTVIDNLLQIKRHMVTGRFNIIIRTNVTNEIYATFDKYIESMYDLFGEDKRFSFFFRPAGDWGGIVNKDVINSFVNQKKMDDMIHRLSSSIKVLRTIHQSFLFPGGSVCSANQKNAYVIDANGDIRKCICKLDEMEHNRIGSLQMNGEMNIDDYKHARWLEKYQHKKSCDNCFFMPACQKGSCPARVVYEDQMNIVCPYEKSHIDEILRLLDKSDCFLLIV